MSSYQKLLDHEVCRSHESIKNNLICMRPRHEKVYKLVDKYIQGERSTLIDIGCHSGFFLRYADGLNFQKYIGVDYIELKGNESFLSDFDKGAFEVGNFNKDNFLSFAEDNSIDCITSCEVFEHILNDPLGSLQECWKKIRPGGVFVMTTPNPCTLANVVRLLKGHGIVWGDVAFAINKKFEKDKEVFTTWDIHFREYATDSMKSILGHLEGAEIVESGFVGTDALKRDSFFKKLFKFLIKTLGLSHHRLFCISQYHVLRKRG